MEFFCYHRDRAGSEPLRDAMLSEHWCYMDTYQPEMIARGPTLADDGETATGSVHILRLAGPAAARAFAFDEPCYQAGMYRDILLRRWRNLLGRTMWDFPGGPGGGHRYLVLGLGPELGPGLGLGPEPPAGPGGAVARVEAAGPIPPADTDELIAFGPLLSDDGNTWLGTAALTHARDLDAAAAVLATDKYASVEVHHWQPGGRDS
jgi:uncharacterized protein